MAVFVSVECMWDQRLTTALVAHHDAAAAAVESASGCVNPDGVWIGFVRFALLLAVVFCWVDRCFASWVLLGLLCLLRTENACNTPNGV